MTSVVPIVNYLELDDGEPHLVSTDCEACGAYYFGTRIACSKCGGRTFVSRALGRTGTIGSFTIIHRAPRGVPTPFVSALVDLEDGTTVKTNIVGCPPDVEHVHLGDQVRLTTYELAADNNGVVAVAFGFDHIDAEETA